MEETVSREIYEDSHTLLREMLKEMSFKFDAKLSFKFKLTEASLSNSAVSPEFGLDKKTIIKEVSEITNTKVNVR